MFMHENSKKQSVAKMARECGVSRSGYYAWRARGISGHEREDAELLELIGKIFWEEHQQRYGSPRVWEELREQYGRKVSRKRVERIMRENGLISRRRKKFVVTTNSKHTLAVSENILNRAFSSGGPGEKWVSDITYLKTSSSWLYLTTVLDLWDRKIVGWAFSNDLSASNVWSAFEMAVGNRTPKEGLLFHSDRGVQYCSEEFRTRLKKLVPTVRQSMSRKGNCWDNACAESFFKTLKRELDDVLDGRHPKELVRTSVFEYIEGYYNRRRRHSALGYAIPVALTTGMITA